MTAIQPSWSNDDDVTEPTTADIVDQHGPEVIKQTMMTSSNEGEQRRLPEVDETGSRPSDGRRRDTNTYVLPFLHRVQPIEHRIQNNGEDNHNNNNNNIKWLDVVDNDTAAKKSAAAFVGGDVFENRDFSRGRESLKYNVDEGQWFLSYRFLPESLILSFQNRDTIYDRHEIIQSLRV